MQAIFHIARNTFRETIRQPIFVVVTLLVLCLMGLVSATTWFVFREQVKMVTDGGLASVMVFGAVIAVLSATHSVSHEIDSGTVLLVMSKPVSLPMFVGGKILGILAALTMYGVTVGCALMILVRIVSEDMFRIDFSMLWIYLAIVIIAQLYGLARNFFRNRSFPAVTAQALFYGFSLFWFVLLFLPGKTGYRPSIDGHAFLGYPTSLIKAVILVMLAVWMLGVLATALSTRFNVVVNLSVCAAVFFTGLLQQYFYGKIMYQDEHEFLRLLNGWFYLLLPLILVMWLLTAKHFYLRREAGIRPFEIHLGFALVSILLTVRIMVDSIVPVSMREPNMLVDFIGTMLFACRGVVAAIFMAMIPNWQLFWMADVLTDEKEIPFGYMVRAFIYFLLFAFLFYLIALRLVATRELGRQRQS